jgi:hypothetical protein
MKKLTILAVLAIAGVLAGIVACGGDNKPAETPGGGTTTTTSSGAASGSAAPAAS